MHSCFRDRLRNTRKFSLLNQQQYKNNKLFLVLVQFSFGLLFTFFAPSWYREHKRRTIGSVDSSTLVVSIMLTLMDKVDSVVFFQKETEHIIEKEKENKVFT